MNKWIIIAGVLLLLGGATMVSTVDPNLEPRIVKIAEAIAYAEGFYVKGSRPQRNNNPGDLTLPLGFAMSGYDGIYVIFATIQDGWSAIRKQVELMLTNRSRIYNRDMTIWDVAQHYTTTQQNEWANNVASRLGVLVSTKISEV